QFAVDALSVYIQTRNGTLSENCRRYQSGRNVNVYAIDCASLEIEKVNLPHLVNANGACKYQEGMLFCCQGDLTTPSALVLAHPHQDRSQILLNTYHGRQFNSINDVVIHNMTGDICFTDPTYGYEQAFRPSPVLPSQVYRFRPATGHVVCVADGFVQCNGLCFSPDYEKMYVTDTGAVQAHGTPGNGLNFSLNPRLPSTIYVYDVVDDGKRLANRRVFAYCSSGVPDGIKCDQDGNI
ncbi:calcium-dependent phosphotriesterase, partial [Polychaeton citri CBS 116435]